MSGLIDSAKQRLWDVVNELGRAQPQPKLRVAIVTYGDPAYGAESGFVRINQPFTSDLDAVNETLFSFGTNGGDEFVARVVDTSLKKLNWNNKGGRTSGAVRCRQRTRRIRIRRYPCFRRPGQPPRAHRRQYDLLLGPKVMDCLQAGATLRIRPTACSPASTRTRRSRQHCDADG